MALADAERALSNLSLRTGTAVAVVDHISRADSADSVDEETISKRRAGGADLGRVEGESLLADTLAVDQNLVFLAGRAG